MTHYNQYKHNTFSQNGEDGVVMQIFLELGLQIQTVCEYGAHNGVLFSNSRKWLIENNARCLLIESGNYAQSLYEELEANSKGLNAICINAKVGDPTKDSTNRSLESLLEEAGFPKDFDLLSVDIDGEDHMSFATRGDYSPKVVIIEINSNRPIEDQTIPIDANNMNFGSSIVHMNKAGYSAVCHTGNLIYVRNDLISKLSIPTTLINSNNLYIGPV